MKNTLKSQAMAPITWIAVIAAAIVFSLAGCDNTTGGNVPEHDIFVIVPGGNGTVSVTVDGAAVTKAAEGKTVTINAEPDPGYTVLTLKVTSLLLQDIAVTNDTFTMPAFLVNVTVVFVPELAYTADTADINSAKDEVLALNLDDTVYYEAQGNTQAGVESVIKPLIDGLDLETQYGVEIEINDISFTAATAGSISLPAGVNGTAVFTVQITKGMGLPAQIPVTITVIAMQYFASDDEAISAAKEDIDGLNLNYLEYNQADGNTQNDVKNFIQARLDTLNLPAIYGVTTLINGVSFTAAATGTFGNEDGTHGLAEFSIEIQRGLGLAQAVSVAINIIAMPYDSTDDDNAAIAAAKADIEAALLPLPMTTHNTQQEVSDHVADIAALAAAAHGVTVSSMGVSFTPAVAGDPLNPPGSNGTYTATLTIGKGLGTQASLAVSITITATEHETLGLYYALLSGGDEYEVSKGSIASTDTAVYIPSRHDGLPVTKIADNAFKNGAVDANNTTNSTGFIKSVYIPPSVTEIGNDAFSDTGLTSVEVPNTVAVIGDNVFNDCADLESAKLPAGITKIPDGTFRSCTSLESYAITPLVTIIGKNAFQASGLKSIIIPPSVTFIDNEAFRSISGGIIVDIPNAVNFGDRVFVASNGITINYNGTSAEFSAKVVHSNGSPTSTTVQSQLPTNRTINCLDGTLN